MKKIIPAVMALLTAVLLCFSGCGKETVSPSELEGTWIRTSNDLISTYTFNSDMTYYSSTETTGEFAVFLDENGTYSLDGATITFSSEVFGDYSYEIAVGAYDITLTAESGSQLIYTKK